MPADGLSSQPRVVEGVVYMLSAQRVFAGVGCRADRGLG